MIVSRRHSGFALAVTLVLMALIVIVIVAYLSNSQTNRTTSFLYANQLRAKIIAESGLAAATKLLADNTRYGNYVTAMPPPSPSPAKIYTELYRPTDPADPTVAKPNDYLQLTNAAGVILASRANPSGTPQVDPRPTPTMIPPAGPFAIGDPGFTAANSYDFNQIVRLGTDASGRLVHPSPTPVYGQWVRVRNSNYEVIGRYAFFIEDESMKTNVNVTGNALGAMGANVRINDIILPPPSPAPTTQVEEVDPTAILASSPSPTPNRTAAMTALANLGASGSRLPTTSSLALLASWNTQPSPTPFSTYAHLITAFSKDDDTTAKGWQRMDLNALVASATDNASKVAVASRIANWIRDAWTGPSLTGLASYQLFNDTRLRAQIAANIVDYIDADDIPTDMGDIVPDGYATAVPVIGIEKIPQLVAVEVIYEASDGTCPSPPVAGTYSATIKMKIQLRFINLYESTVDLAPTIGRFEIQGVPTLQKNGSTVVDYSTKLYSIDLAGMTPVNGGGTIVPPGSDGTSDSGARTFQTGWLEIDPAKSFTVSASDAKPRLLAGKITVKSYHNNTETKGGADDYRVDDTAIVTNLITTGYNWSGSSSTLDFLTDSRSPNSFQTASISLVYQVPAGTTTPIVTGDPRFRGPLLSDRWSNITRSDASTPATTNRITLYIDKAEIGSRAYAFDWYDSIQVRPLAFHRNGSMLSVGELGNVSAAEYPWRTLYMQYPERPVNTVQVGPATEVPLRRSTTFDYILTDLFRTRTVQPRLGALNINSQQRVSTQQHVLNSLFLGLAAGTQTIDQTRSDRLAVDPNSSPAPAPTATPPIYSVYQRRLINSPPADNTPVRPFFQIGELASPISRLINSSIRLAGETRSTVTYSVLRANPTLTSTVVPDYRSDMLAEQEFREISNSVTTRGNVFRVLYVGQSVKDLDADGNVTVNEVQAEFLGEAFLERQATFVPEGTNPDAIKTSGSRYRVSFSRVITQ